MSEEKTVHEEAPVKEKKSWFNRIWAAFCGLIVGIAAMFGIDLYKVADTAQAKIETYKTYAVELKAAVDAKDWVLVKETAVKFSKELTKDVPGDKLKGPNKKAYDLTIRLIEDVDAGKYDTAVVFVADVMKLFKNTEPTEPTEPTAPSATPTVK